MAHKKLQPHDRFTRSSLCNPRVIQGFFKHNLPEKITKMIDLSSIKLCKESYIGDILGLQSVDLLYKAKFNKKSGFLYILIEHASKTDPLLSFRMKKYMMAIMEDHLKTTKSRKLPLIYPIIFYTGKYPYTYSLNFYDLFLSGEKEFAKEIATSSYQLIDLSQIEDKKCMEDLWYGIMALSLKHIHDVDVVPFLKNNIHRLKKLEDHGE